MIMRGYPRLPLFPLLLVFYEIGVYLSNDMYLPALPEMMKDLHLTMQQAQQTLTFWFIGAAIMPLFMGILSDRYGRRTVLIGGGYVYVAATIACIYSSEISLLLAARFIQGSMLASMVVAGYASVHETYEKIEAIKLLAIMSSITILAPALGPLAGGLLLLYGSWRGIFVFIALWSLISVVLLTIVMPETLAVDKRVRIELRPLFKQYGRLLRNRSFIRYSMIMGMIFGGFIMWITAGPLLLIETFRFTPIQFGWIQALVFISYLAGNYLAKLQVDTLGVSRLIKLGLQITLSGSMVMLLILVMPRAISVFIVAMSIYSFGSALCFPPMSRMLIEVSEGPMGLRVALSNVLMTGFGALGTLVVSLCFNGSIGSMAYPIAATAMIAMVLYSAGV